MSHFFQSLFRPRPRAAILWCCGWVVMCLGPGLRAQTVDPTVSTVITTVGEFWNVPEADKHKVHALRMELLVYHYDPAWKLLFGQTADGSSFLPVQGSPMSFRSGQRVRLAGTVVPAEGLDGAHLQVTVLGEGTMPAPLPTAGRLADVASLHGRWVEIEGHVLRQSEPDATHIEADLWCEGVVAHLTLSISGTEPVPQLTGARIRLRGVYDGVQDLHGNIQKLEIWSGDVASLQVLGWLADDERLKLPRTAIDDLGEPPGRPWVRLVGHVQEREPGQSITVRDDTGQIEIATAQPGAVAPGTVVEVIGRPVPTTLGWTLKDPLFRPQDAAAAVPIRTGPGQPPLRLRLAEQVMELAPEEADRRHPVTLRGIITWHDARTGHFYLQDISGGVAVRRLPGMALNYGAAVVVTGVTVRGQTRPEVAATDIMQSGPLTPPPPRRISLEQALTGAEEGRWVEMRGHVRQAATGDGWTRLDLSDATGEFTALLPADESAAALAGAMVRVRGVCELLPGTGGELPEARLRVQDREAITVETPRPADPFTARASTVADVRGLGAAQLFTRPVRLLGTVLLHEPGRYLYFQDGTGGLFVLSRETGRLNAGDQVELVGLPGRLGSRVVLREAVWRPAAAGAEPTPFRIEGVNRLLPEADARLVQLRATLRRAVPEGVRAQLSLQADGTIIAATLHDATGWTAPAEGSRLDLTGIYVVEFDEYRRPHAFRFELRTPADISLHEAPSWWNVRRAVYVIGVLGLFGVLVFAWGITLRRRVRAQTEQLRLQLEKEARLQAELERSSRLESLGVLAGGIAHDFNNLLTAILGNLGLAAMDPRVMAAAGDCITEAERGARRARDITQQLLTFARGGDPVRTAVPLPEIVTEAANFARHGANVRLDFDFPSNLPPGNVDAGQISRVVHNLVINAVQAMPEGGVVSLSLAAVTLAAGEVDTLPAGDYLRLTIADTGRGIPADVLAKIFDPYFSTKSKAGNSGLGLATVRSIVKKHGGYIDVASRVGTGTTFRLWLPAAPHELPAEAGAGEPGAAHLPARILVMDDEEVIRRVAGRMLALAGHETVFAADGAQAIRAYAEARQSGRPFDLVIFDLTVPGGMGGKDALQELLRLDPDIRAVASSGYSSDPVMANPRAYGFRLSLPKPYDIPDLMRAVEEARRA